VSRAISVACVQVQHGRSFVVHDADLLVLPELWRVGYFGFDRYASEALALDDAVETERMYARERRCTVVTGTLERDGGDLFNTVAVISPDGEILGSYRKRHLFTYGSREGELLTPGDQTVVVDTPVGRLGIATCFDLRFPDQFAKMRAMGVDLFVVPAAWPAERIEHWRVLAQARAIENQAPVVGCNGAGDCVGTLLGGHSLMVDATGAILAEAGADPTVIEAKIDHEATLAWRTEFPLA
jgi:predicted amidohydrolase